MKEYKFKPKSSKEFKIVRDYYVSNDHLQGIYFVIKDMETKEIFTRFLKKELISNEEEWEKKNLIDSTRFCMVVEAGEENKVLFQEGTLTVLNKTYGETKDYQAERITFFLKS